MPRTLQSFVRGTLAALCLLGGSALVVSGPIVSVASPPMLYPVARLLPLKVTQAARGATFAALQMQGYEMTPPVKIVTQ